MPIDLFCRLSVIFFFSSQNLKTLSSYIDDRGKIDIRKKTGACAKCQRRIAQAIKRARHLALLPYTIDHIRLSGFSAKNYS